MLWLERRLLCNSFVCPLTTGTKCFAVRIYGTVCVWVCVCMCVCVASKAFKGYATKPRDTQWNFHPRAAANLSSFRMTKRHKERKEVIKNAICCSPCMCCQTIMLQPGAQFSCYTQVYQVLLMLCQKQSDVRWNFLTRLTEKRWWSPDKHEGGTLAHILVVQKKEIIILYWKHCII